MTGIWRRRHAQVSPNTGLNGGFTSPSGIPSQRDRIVVITGTGGLGFQAALEFARADADVILAGRDERKGKKAVSEIQAASPFARMRFELLDLASLSSIASLAAKLERDVAAVDTLICNAGIMSPPKRRTTAEGFELQFGVNYLGHFALAARLLPLLRKSAAPRVVSVTSLAHRYAKVDVDDLQSERRYVPGRAYCVSKLAQAYFAQELQRRSVAGNWGVTSIAAHPGLARTDIFQSDQDKTSLLKDLGTGVMGRVLGHSASAGAAPIVYASTSPEAKGGMLYGPKGLFEMKGPPGPCEFSPASRDPEAASRLWTISEDLAGVRFPKPHA